MPIFRKVVDGGRNHDLMAAMPIDAPELTSVWTWARAAWEGRKDLLFMAHAPARAPRVWRPRVRHPVLRDILSKMFPDIPFSFATAVLGELSRGTLGTVDGGSLKFAEAIARKAESLGVSIQYQQDVDEILVENDRAVGVRTVEGPRASGRSRGLVRAGPHDDIPHARRPLHRRRDSPPATLSGSSSIRWP